MSDKPQGDEEEGRRVLTYQEGRRVLTSPEDILIDPAQIDWPAVGEDVRALRKLTGLTQGELSEAAGVSRQYISQIERARVEPSIETLSELLVVLVDRLEEDEDKLLEAFEPRSEYIRERGIPDAQGLLKVRRYREQADEILRSMTSVDLSDDLKDLVGVQVALKGMIGAQDWLRDFLESTMRFEEFRGENQRVRDTLDRAAESAGVPADVVKAAIWHRGTEQIYVFLSGLAPGAVSLSEATKENWAGYDLAGYIFRRLWELGQGDEVNQGDLWKVVRRKPEIESPEHLRELLEGMTEAGIVELRQTEWTTKISPGKGGVDVDLTE